MKYLDTVLSDWELSSQMVQAIRKYDAIVDKKLDEKEIYFTDEDAQMVFCNHIVALVKRCINRDFVSDIDEGLMEDISKQALDIAQYIVKDIFVDTGCEINKSEVFLVATHIQMYLDSKGV